MKTYQVFRVETDPFIPEIVSGVLWELDIEGISEKEDHLQLFTKGNSDVGEKDIFYILQRLVEQEVISVFRIEKSRIRERNWNEEWEKQLRVIEISDKIAITPSFLDYQPREGQIVVTIDPKMSFGTGEHQSTQLSLLLLEKTIKPGVRVLDVGTGTGVLAIAAVKMGARFAIAIDNNDWCFENARENCRINGVADKVDVRLTEIQNIDEDHYDIILANINKNVLTEIREDLRDHLDENGVLILSGILLENARDIIAAYEDIGLAVFEQIRRTDPQLNDEWVGFAMGFI